MPAPGVDIDTQATAAGLNSAGQSRAQALAGGIPVLPTGNYISGYSAAAQTLMATLSGQTAATVAHGLAQAAVSVATYETTETGNQQTLST